MSKKEEKMFIETQERDGVVILSISGRLDAANAGELKKKYSTLDSEGAKFVFDLSKVDFLDSTGLGSIVSCLKSAVENDGNIKIAGLQPKTRMVFEITRAYKIFDIFDDLESAVASY